jgi:hypothetical protein
MVHDRRSQPRVTVYRAEQRDGAVWEVEYEAIADALHFACRDLREGRRRPIEIVEDGVVMLDAAEIARQCGLREQEENELPSPVV